MADVEIVIKIQKEQYDMICLSDNNAMAEFVSKESMMYAIKNGILLPKKHGTLKDVDNIKTAFPSGEYVRTESVRATIDHEDTIIEADKEESEEK